MSKIGKGMKIERFSARVRSPSEKEQFKSWLPKLKNTPDINLFLLFVEGTVDPAEIEDLFEQLEDFSDSGPDVDTISIGSTPKPSLKPFFCSSKNLLNEARVAVNEISLRKCVCVCMFCKDGYSNERSTRSIHKSIRTWLVHAPY